MSDLVHDGNESDTSYETIVSASRDVIPLLNNSINKSEKFSFRAYRKEGRVVILGEWFSRTKFYRMLVIATLAWLEDIIMLVRDIGHFVINVNHLDLLAVCIVVLAKLVYQDMIIIARGQGNA
eukprot:gene8399-11357_t